MHVTCPACSARYTTDEDKLRGKTARMRCRACSSMWLVSGPEADAAVESEARAAIVKREREKRDLFAPRPSDPGSVKQTLHRPPPTEETIPPRLAALAARGETSVLFTLDGLTGLTGAARIKTPEPEKTPLAITSTRVEDDEGIIDLGALASSPPTAGVPPVPPLFSDPPPAAFAFDAGARGPTSAAPAPSGKRLFGVALAIAAVVVAGVGLAFVFPDEKPAPVAAAPAPPPPPPAIVTPSPQPEPAPAATASTETEAKGATAGNKGRGGKAASAAKGGAKPAPSPKPAATPKAADPCGCKGNFNCVLACTVKRGK